MSTSLCARHGLPLRTRKDKKGKFCLKCVDAKARGNGQKKYSKQRF